MLLPRSNRELGNTVSNSFIVILDIESQTRLYVSYLYALITYLHAHFLKIMTSLATHSQNNNYKTTTTKQQQQQQQQQLNHHTVTAHTQINEDINNYKVSHDLVLSVCLLFIQPPRVITFTHQS